MRIFDFAMQLEKEGLAFYRRQASLAKDKKLREILLTLADEEKRHFELFQKLRDGSVEPGSITESSQSSSLARVKEIFRELTSDYKSAILQTNALDIWNEALRMEERAEAYYTEQAARQKDSNNKKIFEVIAKEERNHVHMISGVISFLKFPADFSDSIQFRNFQSLEGH